ncbi:hypothetical protein D3C74_467100 [compost metagenome]
MLQYPHTNCGCHQVRFSHGLCDPLQITPVNSCYSAHRLLILALVGKLHSVPTSLLKSMHQLLIHIRERYLVSRPREN